ncbi:MAG: M20 family metallo-hydrolase [Deltaproteobacteria bacterium]|nr:M20 family metallo-hydrolase [Deltaproteobacteria bacterium]
MSVSDVTTWIENNKAEIVELQRMLVAIPALSPTYNAPPEQTGEARKVAFLKSYLAGHDITDLTEIEAPDERVPGGVRPSLIARIKGASSERTVWIMAHTDVVPPGDLGKWTSDPFQVRFDDDKIYGRGVEDNHQGLVAGVMAGRALVATGTVPVHDVALLFVADEECGSKFGIQYVLDHANPFRPGDLIIVPDGGSADGTEIEVAEKSICWCKFKITGKQCHASMPGSGNNAMRAGANLIVRLDRLHEVFDKVDPVFNPPISTFEPTKKEANVPNVNTIPGEDIFYLDCRVLPSYDIDEVEAKILDFCDEVKKEFNVGVELSYEQREKAAPATPTDAPIVGILARAVKAVYGVDARPVGIGGGTVAANLRRRGLPCVVWARQDETMHGPDEYARLSNIVGDAKVFANVMCGE